MHLSVYYTLLSSGNMTLVRSESAISNLSSLAGHVTGVHFAGDVTILSHSTASLEGEKVEILGTVALC